MASNYYCMRTSDRMLSLQADDVKGRKGARGLRHSITTQHPHSVVWLSCFALVRGWWMTTMKLIPMECEAYRMHLMHVSASVDDRPDVGSSAKMMSAKVIMHLANVARRFCPP
eukprot:2496489-Amphidinium_carterae.2